MNWGRKIFPSNVCGRDLLSIGLGSLLFFLWFTHYYPFTNPDESRYTEIAREMWASSNFLTPTLNGVPFLDKPPLLYWILSGILQLFGLSELSMRFVPALCGTLGTCATYLFASVFFSRRCALLSATILSSFLLYFSATHYINMDLMVATWITLTLVFTYIAIEKKQFGWMWSAYVCAALGFLTKGLIALVLPGLIVVLYLGLTQNLSVLSRLKIPQGVVLFLGGVCPWFILLEKAHPGFLHYFFVLQHFSRFLGQGFNNAFPFWFYIPILLPALFPWTPLTCLGLYDTSKKIFKKNRDPSHLFLLLWALIPLVFFSIPQSKLLGYILPIFPPLALITAHYLDKIWETPPSFLSPLWASFILFALSAGVVLAFIGEPLIPRSLALQIGSLVFLGVFALIFIGLRKKPFSKLFFGIASTTALGLLTLPIELPYLQLPSHKSIGMYIRTHFRENIPLLFFAKFYYDIPLYAERNAFVVYDWKQLDLLKSDDWRRDLGYGRYFEPNALFLIQDSALPAFLSQYPVVAWVVPKEEYEAHPKNWASCPVVFNDKENVLLVCKKPVTIYPLKEVSFSEKPNFLEII